MCCTVLNVTNLIILGSLYHIVVYLWPFHPRALARRIAEHLQTARRQTRHSLFLQAAGLAIRPVPHCRDAGIPLLNRPRIVGIVPECFALFGCRDVDALQVAHETTARHSRK